MNANNEAEDAIDATVSCGDCAACCCRLEVLLMGDDDVPQELTDVDRWGGSVMLRLDDGWCAALDRSTMKCSIYELRPGVCRDYPMGASDCIGERKGFAAQGIAWRRRPVGS